MSKLVSLISLFIASIFTSTLTEVTKYDLPSGELKWSTVRPKNAKLCVPAAFTGIQGSVIGSYRIKGKNYKTNNKFKISLHKNSFTVSRSWVSNNGFQQIVLVNHSKPYRFKHSDYSVRRALCKKGNSSFLLQSKYPMTLNTFAKQCSKHCDVAVYLDMGEYGYGYIAQRGFKIPLFIWGFFHQYKQTNWLYIE